MAVKDGCQLDRTIIGDDDALYAHAKALTLEVTRVGHDDGARRLELVERVRHCVER